jgi:hypothetical protein
MSLIRVVFSLFLAISAASAAATVQLPKVDLGYEVHQAISFNVSSHMP